MGPKKRNKVSSSRSDVAPPRFTGLMVLQNHQNRLASNTFYDQYVDQIEYDTQSTLVSLFNFLNKTNNGS